MAHQIYENERTGKASVFVVGEPAWHRLGKTLIAAATAEEAIREADLDFEVMLAPNVAQVTYDQFARTKSFSTVRKDTFKVLGSRLSSRYKILQNIEAFKFFDAIVDRKEAIYHSAGVLGHGERVWIMAKLPDYLSIRGLDELEVFVTLFLSHDGSSGISSFIHINRIVCNNTLQAEMAAALRTLKYRHVGNVVQAVSEGAELMGIHNMLLEELSNAFDYMVSKKVTEEKVEKFLGDLFPEPPTREDDNTLKRNYHLRNRSLVRWALEEAAGQDMITTRGTGFGLYNAVTYYIDNMKWKAGKEDLQLKSSWFGADAGLRQRAFDLVMAI